MAICRKKHRYDSYFESLPDAQDNQTGGRHKCAGCAYEEGFVDAQFGNSPKTDFTHLPYSQAGKVRHKDVGEVYKLGYQDGKKQSPQP